MVDLKQMSLQLDQMCKEPCKDTVEIQTITGKGKNDRCWNTEALLHKSREQQHMCKLYLQTVRTSQTKAVRLVDSTTWNQPELKKHSWSTVR